MAINQSFRLGWAFTLALIWSMPLQAAELVVNTEADTEQSTDGTKACFVTKGNCTLRAAIDAAMQTPETDTITFAAPLQINLEKQLKILTDVVIKGQQGVSIIPGSNQVKTSLLHVGDGKRPIKVRITDVEIRDGNSRQNGGCIFVSRDANLSLQNSIVRGCNSKSGGAIYIGGRAEVYRSLFLQNTAKSKGGAIFNAGKLKLAESHLQFNTAKKGAGLWADDDSHSTVTSSTITNNKAQKGAAAFIRSVATISNSVIVDNYAAVRAGGIEGNPKTELTMTNVSIANNHVANLGTQNCSLVRPYHSDGTNHIQPSSASVDAKGKNKHQCNAAEQVNPIDSNSDDTKNRPWALGFLALGIGILLVHTVIRENAF